VLPVSVVAQRQPANENCKYNPPFVLLHWSTALTTNKNDDNNNKLYVIVVHYGVHISVF
jgi:hypothetical protein